MSMIFRFTMTALVASALTMTSTVTFAQMNSSELPEVIVEAETPVAGAGRDARGFPIEVVQLSRRVSYADLHIGTHSGAIELHKRIETAAKAVCEELKRVYPHGSEENNPSGSCIRDAIKNAMPQANAAIAEAEKSLHHGTDWNRK